VAQAVAAQTTGGRRWRSARRAAAPYAYLAPGFFFMTFSTLIAVGFSLWISFTNYDLYHPLGKFHSVGLRNYREILTSAGFSFDTFLRVLEWTVLFAAFSSAISFLIGLGLALLLNDRQIKERNIYRTLLIIPWALPGAITILAWQGLLNVDFGHINDFLNNLGIGKVPWTTDEAWARFSVILVNTWFTFPFMMTACLGALQSVSDDLLEAARIDGARKWNQFRFVVFPTLRSVVVPLLITNYAFQFNNFNIIYLLTKGNPPDIADPAAGGTDILGSYAYKLTLQQQRYGLAAAVAVFIFLIVATISFIAMRASGSFRETT
jgi:arabinogalactan oligomer / maltooligosaccharide transport system permease protein